MTRSKWPSIYPPNRTISRCLYVASSAAPIQIPHPRKLPHFTLSKQWARQISRSTESTGRRQPAAGRKRGRCCMTVHERSLLLYWVAVVVGRRLGLQGAAGGKGKVGKGNANSQTQQPLSIHLLLSSLGKRFSDPTRFFLQKKCCRSKICMGNRVFFDRQTSFFPKRGAKAAVPGRLLRVARWANSN